MPFRVLVQVIPGPSFPGLCGEYKKTPHQVESIPRSPTQHMSSHHLGVFVPFLKIRLLKRTILVHFIAERRPTSVQLIFYTPIFLGGSKATCLQLQADCLIMLSPSLQNHFPCSVYIYRWANALTHTQATMGKLEHLCSKKDCNCMEMESAGLWRSSSWQHESQLSSFRAKDFHSLL